MGARRRLAGSESRRTLAWFLALSALALVGVAAGAAAWSVHVAQAQAISTAARSGRAFAAQVVAPLCTAGLRRGDPAAVVALDQAVRPRMLDGSILRVKVWTPEGTIVYSDAHALIGSTFDLDAEHHDLLGGDHAEAEITNLSRPENHLETPLGRLVETYAAIQDVSGRPLLVETYFPADPVDADADAIARKLTPLALAAIVALQLLQLPVALAAARRLDRAHGERHRLLEHAVAASELERRRIARDLHDGVVQDLSGAVYLLESIQRRLPTDSPLAPSITKVTGLVQADVQQLRQTMINLAPPQLTGESLELGVAGLAGPLAEAGVTVEISVDDTADLPQLTVQLLYRACRELLHNVFKHANASKVTVTVTVAPTEAVLTVADDGTGFDADAVDRSQHMGLLLLTEAVTDAGGTLEVHQSPGAGTTVVISVQKDP
ncbi:sensor histidine kinase [Paractinoplanes rishiriensis]|nr:ATP-binding protein [Actinoplanes rishiriensis]